MMPRLRKNFLEHNKDSCIELTLFSGEHVKGTLKDYDEECMNICKDSLTLDGQKNITSELIPYAAVAKYISSI